MEFDNYTKEKLKIVLDELDFLAGNYDWGTDEFEFLMDLCGQIEDVLRGGRRWRLKDFMIIIVKKK